MRPRLLGYPCSLRVAAVGALALALSAPGWFGATAGAAPEDPDSVAVNRYGGCLASQKAGDLLILVDESGSLQSSDPQAARVEAAKYLVKTLGGYADRTSAKLDVAIAGFAEGYSLRQDWTPLTGASVDSVNSRLQSLAGQNSGADTDYWLALDGARQSLTDRAQGNPNRCQAIAWFSDGKIDFSQRAGSRPYAPDVDLGSQSGITEMIRRATDSICRSGGLADQLRSAHIVMLGVGLGDKAASRDFDVMSAIATGAGPDGTKCGGIMDPKPGAFYQVSNIDQMLLAFDALNPTPRVVDSKPVCHESVCQEARHNFVVDRSVKSVNILGSGGMPGIVPYLISPSGQQLQLPNGGHQVDASIEGIAVSYQWQSESAQTISIRGENSSKWPGQWAIVYVDTTGQHPDAVSRVAIHITTDIYPTVNQNPNSPWRAGQVMRGVTFGLVDEQGKPIDPNGLAGEAAMSAVLAVDGAAPIKVLDTMSKNEIGKPLDIDLTNVKPGAGSVRMSLVITTAPAPNAPGTQLSPQRVDKPIQILPRLGLPAPGERIDFGTVQGTEQATTQLQMTGPGCVWIANGERPTVRTAPDGIATVDVTSTATGPGNCLNLDEGQKAGLPVTLHTDHEGHGGLNGTVPIHIASKDNPSQAQTIDVAFTASMVKALSTTNFVLVLLAALLLGPGVPLILLYAAKWYVSRIPGVPMLAQRIPVEVDAAVVLRDGATFEMADTDLVNPVPGLAGGARTLTVEGVELSAVTGRSPFGVGHVKVNAAGYVSAGSEIPSTDASGLQAVLPITVHGTWVVLHDLRGAPNKAEVLLMVPGQSDVAQRRELYEDIDRRLPETLTMLRRRAVEADLAHPVDGGPQLPTPFGVAPAGEAGDDPFEDAQLDHSPFKPFGGGAR
ncbi:vWA domain-containing protein [Mycobacterium sp.]|uniref:vWA domain-containing protein n=1 Tax=Mycobacterium sp. TaxID=1785 RepID=UPI00261456A3|nr:vWA domain-containing protein [Mycobacterium sp.]